MKARRRVPAPPMPARVAARDHEQARQTLRDFAAFCETHDPEMLAASVTVIDSTLKRCAHIEAFFRAYVRTLRLRVVH